MAGLLGLALMADRRLRRWAMFGLALMTIAAALTPAVRDRFVSLGDGESEETRLNLWKSSVAAIADRPILGWGPGNFGRALAIHEVDGYYESRAHAHNDYLMHAVNGGALALVAALALLAIILGTLWRWRERDPLIRAALAMQLALAVAGLFQVYQTDDEVEIALYLLTGCGLALVVAASHADNSSLES
jgi:O-antigen ligase